MLIDRENEALLHDATDMLIGLGNSSEKWIRWQLARLLIRWNALVIRGEDATSPTALILKHTLDQWLKATDDNRKQKVA